MGCRGGAVGLGIVTHVNDYTSTCRRYAEKSVRTHVESHIQRVLVFFLLRLACILPCHSMMGPR